MPRPSRLNWFDVPQLERSVVVRSTIGEDIDDARCAAPLPRLVACATIAAQALAAASSNRVGSARRRRITRTIQDVVCDLWLVNRGAQAAAIVWVRRANPLGGLVVQLELATRTCAHHAHAGHTKRNVCLSEMQTEKVLDVQHGTCLAPRKAIVDASPLVGVGDAHAAHARQCHFGERQRREEARVRARGYHVRVFNVRRAFVRLNELRHFLQGVQRVQCVDLRTHIEKAADAIARA
eukprot:scaffold78194_cov69-Phaeocystis_antarctica.AAC.4